MGFVCFSFLTEYLKPEVKKKSDLEKSLSVKCNSVGLNSWFVRKTSEHVLKKKHDCSKNLEVNTSLNHFFLM